MLPLLLAGMAGVGIAGGVASYFANKSANERAQMLQDQNFKNWMNLAVPDPDQQKIALQQFVNQGTFTPEMQKAVAQEPSAFNTIVQNADYSTAKSKALSQLQQIGQGGLRLEDKADQQNLMLNSQSQARGDRDAIGDTMARRGLGGSGYDVAARMKSQNSQANRDSNNSLQTAANAQNRALQAIQNAGSMANTFAAQDFSQQAQKASANDAINRFNTQNMQNVNAANVGAQNQAGMYNLQNKQRIADANVGIANDQQKYNKNLVQQQYENQLNQLKGANGLQGDMVNNIYRQGQTEGNLYSNIGQTGVNLGSQYANYDLLNNYLGKNKETPEEVV